MVKLSKIQVKLPSDQLNGYNIFMDASDNNLTILMVNLKNRKKQIKVEPFDEQTDSLENKKNLNEYDQSHPTQLSLFELLLPQEKGLSNTIELYDFIPKYHWGKVERIGGEFLRSLEREFECRGQKYKVKIRPASIDDKDGKERYYYPSKREELVEDALRKFVAEGQGVFWDDAAGVTFTLYQLQEELRRNGHSYSKQEIKDALLICARTNITVTILRHLRVTSKKSKFSGNFPNSLNLWLRYEKNYRYFSH